MPPPYSRDVRDIIPTNLITGFLGVGKTTAIARLLAQKPEEEQWAVLVNEFGQVGIDGALLDNSGVHVRQVPGGCLCCVASQAFTVGLNRLIREHRPDRLLIEPSGLGHPARVLDTLRGIHYREVLDVRATVCLVDPRHLLSERHRQHQNFLDQVRLADVLVASKTDICDTTELEAFDAFAAAQEPAKRLVARIRHGALDPDWLDLQPLGLDVHASRSPHAHRHAEFCEAPITGSDWQRSENRGDGYFSLGWTFPVGQRFNGLRLLGWLREQGFERVKGILLTDGGWQALNLAGREGGLASCNSSQQSRLEILHPSPLPADELEQGLRACLLD